MVDCNNLWVVDFYDYLYLVVLYVLKKVVDDVYLEGKLVSICGEMVGDFVVVVLLMVMGFDSLLMNVINLFKVKWLLC